MEAVLSSLASALLEKLFNGVTDAFLSELKKISSVNTAVQSLETTVKKAQGLLLKVDLSRIQGKAGQNMESQFDTLNMLCYDAEDVIDEMNDMMLKHNSGSGKKILWPLLAFSDTQKIDKLIKRLQKNFDGLSEQLRDLSLMEGIGSGSGDLIPEIPSNGESSYVRQEPFVGRDNDVDEIIQKLTSNHSKKGVSIVGMHGLGKTMLAQTIICNQKIVQEFPVRLWVSMSDGCFKKEDVINRLAKDASEKNVALKQRRKNLLIVLDNLLVLVRKMDWEDFRTDNLFKEFCEVKILITTLNPRISEITSTCAHNLKYLCDDSCRDLIVKKACSIKQNLSGNNRFFHVAGELASKCAGLPLVARIIGVLLATGDVKEWNNLLEEDLWKWEDFKNEILPVLLSSSYKNIEPHLKRCLAYLSLFPQNHCVNRDELVQLWVGEGFIKQLDNSSLEQIGKDCIDDLLRRSILQFSGDANETGRQSYWVHTFTQTFARLVASKTCLQLEGVSTLSSIDKNTRHLSLLCEDVPSSTWQKMAECERLRTILSLYAHNNNVQMPKIPRHLFKSLTWLRVLGLSRTHITEVPDSIYKLEHLRYLDVSETALKNLPDKLSTLPTLKFLKLKHTPLSHLPKDFQNLTSLLFIDWDISDLKRLGQPSHIGKLSSLQTLPLFLTGDKDGYSIAELQNMNHLHCSICIMNLENVKDREEAESAMLDKKKSLRRIELQWNKFTNSYLARDILTGLRPPPYLEELKITAYSCDIFPDWIAQPLPMLEKIHLQRCHNCTVLPAFGQLLALRTLIIQEMQSIISVDNSFCGQLVDGKCFPSLNKLEFNDMPKLQNCTGLEASRMPQLCFLKFVNCPMMNTLPSLTHLTSLVDLQIERCKSLVTLPDVPTLLKYLIVSESDKVEAQHFQTGGSERRKVEHIPYIEINGIQI